MSLCPCCRQPLPLFDDLVVDLSGILVRNGQFVALTRQEFAVFQTLASAPGRVKSKQQLLSALYWQGSDEEQAEIKIIDVFICKIRKKITPLGIEIQTVWGYGYRFMPVAEARRAA